MKLLSISKYYVPYVGGVERTAHAVNSAVAEQGGSVRAVATRDEMGCYVDVDRVDGVAVIRYRAVTQLPGVPVSPGIAASGYSFGRWADIIHVHIPYPVASLAALCGQLASDCRLVVTVHALISDGRWNSLKGIARPLWAVLFEKASTVVFTSPTLARRCSSRVSEEKRVVIPPCSGATLAEAKRATEAENTGRSKQHGRLLFVGRLTYYKGIEFLLEAIKGLSVSLDIVGEGACKSKLRDSVDRMGLGSQVTFHGYVSDESLAKLYKRADLFVLPSISGSEAFGIVQVEAMSFGVPVINTNLPTGVPWVSRHGETGLTVPPRDPGALRSAITSLLEDEDTRRSMSSRAVQRAKRFSRERIVDEYLGVFQL